MKYGYIVCIKKYVTIIGVTTRIVFDVFNRIRIINNEWTVIGFITTIDILYNIKDEKDINNNTIRYTMTFNLTVIKQNKDIEEQTVGVKDKNGISMIPSTKKTYNNNNNNRWRLRIMKGQHAIDFEKSQNAVQILQDRLLKELCSRDYHSKRLGKVPIFDIDEIYKKSFTDVEKQYFLKFLRWFAQESEYVQFLFEGKIAITFLGRNYCIISNQYR